MFRHLKTTNQIQNLKRLNLGYRFIWRIFVTMYSKFSLSILLIFSLGYQGYTQQEARYAFMRVSHYSNMPYMMPDYFQDEVWSDSLMQFMAESMRKTLKLTKVDYKQHQAISYHPTNLPEESIGYNFKNTSYEYFIEVQTQVKLGNNKKQLAELDKGSFLMYLRVYDQKQRKILQQSTQIRFLIEPNKDGLGDAWLHKNQFKQLYHEALQAVFLQKKITKTPIAFLQMPSEETASFLKEATKTHIYTEARGQYKWLLPDTSFTIGLELQMPHYEDKTHRREATFMQAGKVQNQLKGLLADKKPQEIFVQFIKPQLNLGALQTAEVLDIAETSSPKTAWTWLAYQHNGMVKIYHGDEIKAILIKKEGYECYLSPNLTAQDLQMLTHLLMAEVLIRALQKQYEFR